MKSSSSAVWLCTPLILIGVCVGAVVLFLRTTGLPREFISLSKVVVSSPGPGYSWEALDDLGTIIETLEGAEMRRRALDRVRVLHPKLVENDVRVRVSHPARSTIYNIRVFGGEPKYTRVFNDALLDEFMAFRAKLPAPAGSLTITVMERASGAVEDIKERTKPVLAGALVGGGIGAAIAFLIASFFGGRSAESSGGKSFGP